MPTVNTHKIVKVKRKSVKKVVKLPLLEKVVSAIFILRFGQVIPQDLEVIISDIAQCSGKFLDYRLSEDEANKSLKKSITALKGQAQEELFKRYLKPMDIAEVMQVYSIVRKKVLNREPFIINSNNSTQIYKNMSGMGTLLALNIYEMSFPLTQFSDQSMYDVFRAIISCSYLHQELVTCIKYLEGGKTIDLSSLQKGYILALLQENALLGPFKDQVNSELFDMKHKKELLRIANALSIHEILVSHLGEVDKNMNETFSEFESLFDDFSKTPERMKLKENFAEEIRKILFTE